MKKISLVLWIIYCLSTSFAQTTGDSVAIKGTASDYADGFYTADVARMERAIYPDLNKARPAKIPQTGNIAMTYSTYSGLLEATRSKVGLLEESKRNLSVAVLNINDEVANAKVLSARFCDYLQMVKMNDQWKIINVLWTDGLDSPNRIKDFKPEEEKEAIMTTAQEYMNGMYSGDTKRLELVVHPEYNRVTITKMQGTGKVAFRKQKFSSLIENSYAKVGLVDEPKRIIQVKIIDIMDGLAVAEIYTESTYEYVQMFKAHGQWQIFNSIVKPNPHQSFYASLPAMAGLPMPDFTLPIYGGGEFSLSKNRGKNILLFFLRGSLGNRWCTILSVFIC